MATYVDDEWSRGREATTNYCDRLSDAFRMAVDIEYFKAKARKIGIDSECRFPIDKREFIAKFKKIINMYISELVYGKREESMVLYRVVDEEELEQYLSNPETIIRSPRSFCCSLEDAIRFADSVNKGVIIEFSCGNVNALDINGFTQVRFSNENESKVTGGRVYDVR